MMIQMFVAGIGLEQQSGQPIVLLNDADKHKALPIMIGLPEAKAISKALQHVKSKRPSTHDLLFDVIEGFGYELDHVAIDHGPEDYYESKVALVPINAEMSDSVIEIDSRPSDALVLAIMRDAPVYVDVEVLNSSGIDLDVIDEQADQEKFVDFVKDLKASDFNKYGQGPVELP